MGDHELFILATRTSHAFRDVLSTVNDRHPWFRMVLAAFERFELWAGFMGVFSNEKASLDQRLKFNSDLVKAIAQMLELLCKTLESSMFDATRFSTC
jgi:hypothetical protein